MIRVAAYCRVSTDREDQANSFESQQRYFQAYIRRNPDWSLQRIYADEGLSGTSTKKRVQFNAMIVAARAGELDLIVTKEVSRFARNTLDALAYTRELHRHGVGVLFLLDNIDTRSQEGELRLTIMSSLAQEESRKTSQRVKWGQTRRMEQGVVFGGSLLGYDVKDGKITVNPAGAAVVRRIFSQYLDDGMGAASIAKSLRQEGVLSSRGNVSWSAATVLKILKNEKYCGDLVQKKSCTPDYLTHEKRPNRGEEALVILREHHQAIIPRDMWEAVQQERVRRGGGRPSGSGGKGRHPLSGKIRCGSCGSIFLSRTKRRKSGECYRVWRCGKAVSEGAARLDDQGALTGCGIGRQLREDAAMALLRQAVDELPLDREKVIRRLTALLFQVLHRGQKSEGGTRLALQRELEREGERRRRAVDAFLDGTLTREDFLRARQTCDNRIAMLERELSAPLPAANTDEVFAAALQDIIWGGADDAFYAQLLDHMTLWPDGRVEVKLIHRPVGRLFLLEDRQTVQGKSAVPISVRSPFSSG